MRIKFIIPGEPQGKGRPRATKIGDHIRTYTPEKTVVYENLIRMEFQRQCIGQRFPDGEPVDLRIMAFYRIPKSASKKKHEQMISRILRPTKKPDADNIIKVVADSLNELAYKDDTQVVDTMFRKFYSDTPRLEVILQTATI